MSVVAAWDEVSRRYRDVDAVLGVTLALRAGEVTALVGHNGAGKTTLVKLLLGLIRPSKGRVRVFGADPAGRRGAQARRGIGFLPESVAFHGAMTGRELLAFHARLKGAAPLENAALLERVGIADAADRRVATYSKGMRQRLGIAQALIGSPRLLVFDEPTSGLDPASRGEVYRTIDALRADGATVLVCTHALAEVQDRVDRIAIMHGGRLLAAGTLAELRQDADIRTRIDIRVRSGCMAAVQASLPAAAGAHVRSDTELTLLVPASVKMSVLKTLATQADAAVLDVELSASGLQEIYDRLVQGARTAA